MKILHTGSKKMGKFLDKLQIKLHTINQNYKSITAK